MGLAKYGLALTLKYSCGPGLYALIQAGEEEALAQKRIEDETARLLRAQWGVKYGHCFPQLLKM